MTVEEKKSLKIKLFGSISEVVGSKEVSISAEGCTTVGDLKQSFYTSYPKLALNNAFLMVAVNRKLANDSTKVTPKDEIAILPLVSGG